MVAMQPMKVMENDITAHNRKEIGKEDEKEYKIINSTSSSSTM